MFGTFVNQQVLEEQQLRCPFGPTAIKQVGVEKLSHQGRRVATRDVKPDPQESLITKSVSQFLKSSTLDCETAPLHVKCSKAESVNNKSEA